MVNRSRHADTYEEGTDAYDWTHVDPDGLNYAFDIVKRLRKGKGFVGPQYDWFDTACPAYKCVAKLSRISSSILLKFPSSRLSYNPSQVAADKIVLNSAIKTRAVLRPAADALYKIWGHVSRQLETCESRIDAFDIRRGFYSLPDEILSTVLEYASQPGGDDDDDDNEDHKNDLKKLIVRVVKSATKLSHVCKRFRDLIIRSPCLWNRVFNGMGNTDMVSTCLSRCRRGNGQVTLASSLFELFYNRYIGQSNLPFIRAALGKLESWESFYLKGDEEQHTSARFVDHEEGRLEDYAELAKDLDVPNLTRLLIHYPQPLIRPAMSGDAKYREAMHFYSRWSTPRLQYLYARNFIPIPFSGARSLTSVNILLLFNINNNDENFERLDVESFVSFLAACPNLEKLALTVDIAKYHSVPTSLTERLEMPSVTQLELGFRECTKAPLKTLFGSISFPNVSRMKLWIRCKAAESKVDMHFDDVFYAIVPNADAFPRLTEMTLDVDALGFWDEEGDNYIKGRISIPFAVMPKLRSFVFSANSTEVNDVPGGVALLPIRTLALNDCFEIKKEWIAGFLRVMKAQEHTNFLRMSVGGRFKKSNQSGLWGALSKEDIERLIASDPASLC